MAHSFQTRPHRTLLALSVPVLFSLIAEPLTGLADTAFVARLGAVPLAALGAGTVLISSIFWIFNFLSIGTQTEVARAWGAGRDEDASRALGTGLVVAGVLGLVFAILGWFFVEPSLRFMGATGEMTAPGSLYVRIRLLGAPSVLLMTVAFGALRGRQDMATPLKVAVAVNILNIALDALLVLGLGPFPRMGIAGAAWASVIAQWLGAFWAVTVAVRATGWPDRIELRSAFRLLMVGRDLFLRTGLLIGFLALATRAATKIGAEAGAAHQAVRQMWMLGALLLDAFAVAGQSLAGYFLGRGQIALAKRVAVYAVGWGLAVGLALAVAMMAATSSVAALLVPEEALSLFLAVWWIAAVAQPLNALSFVTDGIHWATRDYAFLRNVVLLASLLGGFALLLLDPSKQETLAAIWWITGAWIAIRALFGVLRVWPGIGKSPLHVSHS